MTDSSFVLGVNCWFKSHLNRDVFSFVNVIKCKAYVDSDSYNVHTGKPDDKKEKGGDKADDKVR